MEKGCVSRGCGAARGGASADPNVPGRKSGVSGLSAREHGCQSRVGLAATLYDACPGNVDILGLAIAVDLRFRGTWPWHASLDGSKTFPFEPVSTQSPGPRVCGGRTGRCSLVSGCWI
jgi:hypothetical protein